MVILLGFWIGRYFPILDGGILPDPWEMMFDGAGEVVAMTYLAVLINTVNMAPYCFIAGLLDRAPSWHTVTALFVLTAVLGLFWPEDWRLVLISSLLISCLLTVIYLAGRGVGHVIRTRFFIKAPVVAGAGSVTL